MLEGHLLEVISYGSGHINDTYLMKHEKEDGTVVKHILQRMNREVFTNPVELMENVIGVTDYLRKKILEAGGDPERETLNLAPTRSGQKYFVDSQGEYWRVYQFIENATSYDAVEKPDDFYQSALAFGHFQRMLADYPAETLHETIPNFHNFIDRMEKFKAAVETDTFGRAKNVREEIQFALEHERDAHILCDMLASGELPLRVTHNDTKLNNIMIDDATGVGICVIDLDTVMPGLAVNDFGDSIRFGASTAAEDEQDLDKVFCDLDLFELYTRGFLKGCEGSLTEKEIEMLPMGAKIMTLECGIRFLTDYLEGDHYFKIHREGQNLDRCRTQFKLVTDMEAKWEKMAQIVKEVQKINHA
ncbi:MAG: aminoglycoside phosphotransferase family protein [Candidatus Limivivens sp.]|nr:aminoglycoside phosphotransferase family protein [Candidatus Limivivens sp.]